MLEYRVGEVTRRIAGEANFVVFRQWQDKTITQPMQAEYFYASLHLTSLQEIDLKKVVLYCKTTETNVR